MVCQITNQLLLIGVRTTANTDIAIWLGEGLLRVLKFQVAALQR